MQRTRIGSLLAAGRTGSEQTVMGWVRTKRDAKGGFSFLEVNDGSSLDNLQVIADGDLPNYGDEVLKVQTGCAIRVSGILQASPGKGQKVELHARELSVLGWSDPATYPLQKKRHSFEFLRTIAHLRPRTNTFGAVARIRNALSLAVHSFFQERGFIYLHTPILTGSDCEGAGEMFRVTALDLNALPRKEEGVDFNRDFFGRPAHLTVSGQLEAEIYALSLGDVYTFGPTFRAEDSNTSRHLAEFWMVEPEMAFCDLEDNVALAVELVKHLFAEVLSRQPSEVAFFERFIDPGVRKLMERIATGPFERITYSEAVEQLAKADEPFEFPVDWGKDMQSEHEKYLCEQVFAGPVVITDYPREIKPFYMKCNADGRTVRAMDLLVPKIGEIIGGSQREDDYDTLLNRMKDKGIDPEAYWWYLELRKFGSAPHAGFGLGFERLVQLATGMQNIRDVIPFPRTPGNLGF